MRIQTFHHEGRIYTSPTRDKFPSQGPPSPRNSPPTSADSWERCSWAKQDYPELAFYPTSLNPIGSLFHTLRFYPRNEIPLEKRLLNHLTVYRFADAELWNHLEVMLLRVRRTLQESINILVEVETIAIPNPSSEAYMNWDTNPDAARQRAFYARKKFLYSVAMISFSVAVLALRHGDDHAWYTLLLESGLDAHLVDQLSSSVISDFSSHNPRAGAFFEASMGSWSQWLPALIRADVPVFVDWGPVHSLTSSVPPFLKGLYPDAAAVDLAVSCHNRAIALPSPLCFPWRLKEGADWMSGSPRLLGFTQVGSHPSPERHPDRQYTWKGLTVLEGEAAANPPEYDMKDTPGKFFRRRAAYRQHFIDHIESSRQREVRLKRENDARQSLISPQCHDEIFEWDYDFETMAWRRRLVRRNGRTAVWEFYDCASKRYDPVAGEWDLALFLKTDRTLAPSSNISRSGTPEDSRSPHSGSDEPFFRDEDYCLEPPPPDVTPFPDDRSGDPELALEPSQSFIIPFQDSPHPKFAATAHFEPEAGELPSTPTVYIDEQQEVPHVISLVDVVTTRHALILDSACNTSGQMTSTVYEACKIFGYYPPFHGTNEVIDNAVRGSCFAAWVNDMTRANSLPVATSWLLHPQNNMILCQHLHSSDVYMFRMDALGADGQSRSIYGLTNKRRRSESSQSDRSSIIAVEDPTTVLAIVRSFSKINNDVSRWLVASGIPFHLLFPLKKRTHGFDSKESPREKLRLPRLIARSQNHVFTAKDYHSYEEARDYLLNSSRRVMRAALLAGGILWRLAIEATMPDVALQEPDYIACAQGISHQYLRHGVGSHDSDIYVDDALTRDEIRILIGTYVVSHRDRDNPENSAFPMWWPEPSRFKGSSLDLGSWTPVDEHWYRKLRERYRGGAAQPKLGRAWRTSLRNFDKRSRGLMSRSRSEAQSFLDAFLSG